MTKVSVVTTVYNESENFDKAPPSILEQTYEDFEWIILDDDSEDNTVDKLYSLSDKDDRIRVLETDIRRGRAICLNQAIKVANGDYIAQQDFDDISYSHRIKVQKNFLDKHKSVGVVGGFFEQIDEIRGEEFVREVPTDHRNILDALSKYIPFAHTLVMFRKEAWRDAGGYPIKEDIEDHELWVNIAAQGWKLRNIPEVLGKHFIYKESSWHRRFEYAHRQRRLARAQAKAISKLDLPTWRYVYVIGRYAYPYLPDRVKQIVRRTIAGVKERNYN